MDKNKLTNIQVSGINFKDYPDFVDAFIESAELDGKELTEDELEKLNQDSDFVYAQVINKIY